MHVHRGLPGGPSAGALALLAAPWNKPQRAGGAIITTAPCGARTEQDQNTILKSLRASIFYATGAVFVFMQIARAARWARVGSAIHHQAVASSQPCRLPGPRRLASAVVRPLTQSAPRATVLSWTLGDTEKARGQVGELGNSQMEGPHDEMGGSLSL